MIVIYNTIVPSVIIYVYRQRPCDISNTTCAIRVLERTMMIIINCIAHPAIRVGHITALAQRVAVYNNTNDYCRYNIIYFRVHKYKLFYRCAFRYRVDKKK